MANKKNMDGSIHSVYMEKEAKTSLYGEKRSSMYILVQKKKKLTPPLPSN